MKNYSKLIIIEAGIILQTQIVGKIIVNNNQNRKRRWCFQYI